MEFLKIIKGRCSSREFSGRKIREGDIERIIDCARFAPTARGEQPWEFIVVTKKESLKDLAEITDHGKFIKDAAACVAVICRDTKYYLEDGCAATENILLGARALGIGSCWVAGDKKPYAQAVLGYLNIPAGFKLISLIALGYPKNGFNAPAKRPLEELLHREKF